MKKTEKRTRENDCHEIRHSVEILTVDGHEKYGEYVSSRLHLNVTCLIEADPDEPLAVKADENSDLAWFAPGEAVEKSAEPRLRERIYSKLNEKLRAFTPHPPADIPTPGA